MLVDLVMPSIFRPQQRLCPQKPFARATIVPVAFACCLVRSQPLRWEVVARMSKTRSHRQATAPFPPSVRDRDWGSSSYVAGQTLPPEWLPEAYGKWLFEFLRTDLSTLTTGQQLGCRADLWAFVRPELIEGDTWEGTLPPLDVVAALQRDAREGIHRIRKGDWFGLERGISYGIAILGRRIVRGERRGTFSDLFRAAVMDTVQTFWNRLHECPRCHEMFLKVGKRSYCSAVCASRAHWAAFKKRRGSRDHVHANTRKAYKGVWAVPK